MNALFAVHVARRDINSLLSNASLGVTGASWWEQFTVQWAAGELVTSERAEKLCPAIRQALSLENNEFIHCSLIAVYP